MNSAISTASPSVPIISVTPHSPAGIGIPPLNKQYAVLGLSIHFLFYFRQFSSLTWIIVYFLSLEDNLKQLHDIVEAVQHMKDVNISAFSMSSQVILNNVFQL